MANPRWRATQALGLTCAFIFLSPALTTADAQISYEYDALGRLVKKTDTREGLEEAYAYDALGNRTSVDGTLATAVSFSVSNNPSPTEASAAVFTIAKSGEDFLQHTVNYATANGTAGSGDYTAASSTTLTFAPGESSKQVSIATTHDTTDEPNETFTLNLSSPSAGATIASGGGSGTATIIDDDDPVNYAPVAVNDYAYTDAFGEATIYPLSNDTDANGHTINYVSHSTPSGALATWNATNKTMALSAWASGNYTITYNINDGHGGTDQGSIFLEVTAPDGYCEYPSPGSGFWVTC